MGGRGGSYEPQGFSGPNLQVRMEQDFVHQPQLVAEDY